MSATVRPTRRTLLAMGLAVVPVLGACAADTGSAGSVSDPVRRESLGDELHLVALYQAAIAQRGDLESTLSPILAAHQAHADALQEGLTGTPPAQPAITASISADVLAQLRAAEREAVALRSGACTRTDDGDLASLLCLISASEAQHVAVLANAS